MKALLGAIKADVDADAVQADVDADLSSDQIFASKIFLAKSKKTNGFSIIRAVKVALGAVQADVDAVL